jgi:hypothetical protein
MSLASCISKSARSIAPMVSFHMTTTYLAAKHLALELDGLEARRNTPRDFSIDLDRPIEIVTAVFSLVSLQRAFACNAITGVDE